MLNAYGMKFRRKGEKDYIHGIFFAKSEKDAAAKITNFIKEDEFEDIDKRTVSWAGVSSPLSQDGEPFFIHGEIEEIG